MVDVEQPVAQLDVEVPQLLRRQRRVDPSRAGQRDAVLLRRRLGDVVGALVPEMALVADLAGDVVPQELQVRLGVVDRGARDLLRRLVLDLVGPQTWVGAGVLQQVHVLLEHLGIRLHAREVGAAILVALDRTDRGRPPRGNGRRMLALAARQLLGGLAGKFAYFEGLLKGRPYPFPDGSDTVHPRAFNDSIVGKPGLVPLGLVGVSLAFVVADEFGAPLLDVGDCAMTLRCLSDRLRHAAVHVDGVDGRASFGRDDRVELDPIF